MYYSDAHQWLMLQTRKAQKDIKRLVEKYAREYRRSGGDAAAIAEMVSMGLKADLRRFSALDEARDAAVASLLQLDPVGGEDRARGRLIDLAIDYHGQLMR